MTQVELAELIARLRAFVSKERQLAELEVANISFDDEMMIERAADALEARIPQEDEVERVARAIANCEWDRACSALGTPNMPRGGNWSAKLPEARAAIAAMRLQVGATP